MSQLSRGTGRACDALAKFACEHCGRTLRPRIPLPAQALRAVQFNDLVQMDVLRVKDTNRMGHSALLVVDIGTRFGAVGYLHGVKRVKITGADLEIWLSWAGPPGEVEFGQAGPHRAAISDLCERSNSIPVPIPAGAHHKLGFAERRVGVIKGMLAPAIEEVLLEIPEEFGFVLAA